MQPKITCLAYRPAVCTDRATTATLLVRLTAPKVSSQTRPSLNLGLCIDRSGSMGGEPLYQAKQAALGLIRRLSTLDRVGVVVFDHLAEVLCPLERFVGVARVEAALNHLEARGGTDLFQGWSESCHQLCDCSSTQSLNRVLLLSDGETNTGVTDPTRIAAQVARWQRQGVSTTTVGLGQSYNEDLLAAMARAGSGNYFHVGEPKDIESFFAQEIQNLSKTTGQAVSLGVEPADGVEVLRVFNPVERTKSGRLKLGNLVDGAPLEVVVELLVPPQAGVRDLCRLRLAWTEVGTGLRQRVMKHFSLPVVPYGQLSEFPVVEEVAQKKAVQLAGETLREAVQALDRYHLAEARGRLIAGLDLLREVEPSQDISDLAQQMNALLSDLDRGETANVRKQATSSSQFISSGSLCMAKIPALAKWHALPESERTTEALKSLFRENPDV